MNHAKTLNRFVRILSLAKVPLLGIARPTILELTETTSLVKLPLNWLTKNHVGSMYFGALAMGAELSVASQVLQRIQKDKLKVNFIFKDFKAEFLKRADTDVHFRCDQVAQINALIEKAQSSGERVDAVFPGTAVSAKDPSVVFMTFALGMSLKMSKSSVF